MRFFLAGLFLLFFTFSTIDLRGETFPPAASGSMACVCPKYSAPNFLNTGLFSPNSNGTLVTRLIITLGNFYGPFIFSDLASIFSPILHSHIGPGSASGQEANQFPFAKSPLEEGDCWGPCKEALFSQMTGSNSENPFSAPTVAEPSEASITTPTLTALVKSKIQMRIVDTRTSQSGPIKRIPGSIHFSENLNPDEIASFIPQKNFLVILYCNKADRTPNAKYFKLLKDLGYLNVAEYSDGVEGWIKAGQPLEER